MSERKKHTKPQRDLLELCAARPAEGLTIDVIRVPRYYCGVTEACRTAFERSNRSRELPAFGHTSAVGAWDAMWTLAHAAKDRGTGYAGMAHAAVKSHAERSHNGCIFAFDNAQGFMDCGSVDLSVVSAARSAKWDKIVTAFEDAQGSAGCPVRLIFFMYKSPVYVLRDADRRWLGYPLNRYPGINMRFGDRLSILEWNRDGLTTGKTRSDFFKLEQAEASAAVDLIEATKTTKAALA